jgi:hypothetical protein
MMQQLLMAFYRIETGAGILSSELGLGKHFQKVRW